MSLEKAVLLYSVILGFLLLLMAWMLFRHWAEKRRKAQAAAPERSKEAPIERHAVDWLGVVNKLRPDKLLTGEMWVKAIIAAFIALCVGTIVVVFVFPLGAAWAAIASFTAVVVIVGLFLILMD